MNFKKIFLLFIVTLLFVGMSYATEVSNNNTSTSDTSTVDTSTTKEVVVQSSNTPIKEANNNLTYERNIKDISKQNNTKTVKTASKTIDVNDFNTLHNTLTSDTYSTLTLNIKSDIKLTANTMLNEEIKTLTINGNGKTINGGKKYQFLGIESDSKVTIKNIKIINCYSSYGGAIDNLYGTLTIINSTLNNNKAKNDGGAIDNFCGSLTITNTILNNNIARQGGAIYNLMGALTVKNTTLNNNNANYGGGAIYNCDEPKMIIINSTLKNNNAKYDGGAIFYYGQNGLIDKNTFIRNKVNNTGPAIIDNGINTIMKNNSNADTSIDSSTIYINGTDTRITNNIFDDGRKITIITVGSAKSVVVGRQMSIYGKLTDNNGKNLAYQPITIKVDGKTYKTNTTQYGNYNIKHTSTTGGFKTITATYAGTNTYVQSTAKSTFTTQSTIITVGSTKTVPVGKQMSIYGKLTDNNGKNLAYQPITIKVDGKTYKTNTTQYGNYNIKHTPTNTGTKTITVNYAGNNINPASSNSTTFQVKQNTIITIGSTKTAYVGDNVSVYGKLSTTNGVGIAYADITVSVDGKTYKATTSKYGNYNLKVTSNTAGTKTIIATYKGTNIYTESTNKTTYLSNQKVSQITIGSTKSAYVGDSVSVYGKLTVRGINIPYAPITITVDGKTYNAKTSKYGNYNLKVTSNTAGTKTITATYKGTNIYTESTNTTTFMANKKTSIITVGSTNSTYVGDTISVYGKLSVRGIGLAYKEVVIDVEGEKYYVTTSKYGNYNIKVKAENEGYNYIAASYAGTNIYTSDSAYTYFQASKKSTTITVGCSQSISIGKEMSIYGKLTMNGKALAYKTVYINVVGDTYTETTDKYGNYNMKVTIYDPSYKKITATYYGDENTPSSSATTTFTTKYPTLELKLYKLTGVNYPTEIQVGSDTFFAWYDTHKDSQYGSGAHVDIISTKFDTSLAPHYALVDAVFFFKNSAGDIYVDSYNYHYYYSYMGHSWVSGYTPYKVIVSYRKVTEYERNRW